MCISRNYINVVKQGFGKLRYLFWNTNKKSINDYLVKLSLENNYDMILLAEYEDDINELLKKCKREKLQCIRFQLTVKE